VRVRRSFAYVGFAAASGLLMASFYIKDVQASFEEYAGPGDADNLSPEL